jgi:hypothetical protein
MSAMAPAGRVNSAKGSAETVAISEMSTVEAPSEFSAQKAVVLWAATQLPEITLANQSLLKVGFPSASQIELFLIGWLFLVRSPSPTHERRIRKLSHRSGLHDLI